MNSAPSCPGSSSPIERSSAKVLGSFHCAVKRVSATSLCALRVPTSMKLRVEPCHSEQSSNAEQNAAMIERPVAAEMFIIGSQYVAKPPSLSRSWTCAKYSLLYSDDMPAFT